jgi:hypothetical protein
MPLISSLFPLQAGINYEYDGLGAALPKKAKKTKFDD